MDFTADILLDALNVGGLLGILVLFIRGTIVPTAQMDKTIKQQQQISILVAKTVGEEITKGLKEIMTNAISDAIEKGIERGLREIQRNSNK